MRKIFKSVIPTWCDKYANKNSTRKTEKTVTNSGQPVRADF